MWHLPEGIHAVAMSEKTMLQESWFPSLILISAIHSLHNKEIIVINKQKAIILSDYGEQKTTIST